MNRKQVGFEHNRVIEMKHIIRGKNSSFLMKSHFKAGLDSTTCLENMR